MQIFRIDQLLLNLLVILLSILINIIMPIEININQ